MRAALAAIRCGKGESAANLARHLELLASAAAGGCDLVLFPEMSLSGSVDPVRSVNDLMSLGCDEVEAVVAATAAGPAACFGLAERTGDGLAQITQVAAVDGRLAAVQRKRHLGAGEEHFSPAVGTSVFTLAGTTIGIVICAEAGHDGPVEEAAAAGASLVLFPAAPGLHGRRTDEASWRSGFAWWEESALGDARRHAVRNSLFVALSSQAGSTVDEDFPGLAALVAPSGEVVARLPDWREGVLVVDLPL